MDKEEKVAHVNGRYLVAIAILGLIGTLATLIYQSKKESQNPSTHPISSGKKDETPNIAISESKKPKYNKTINLIPTTQENQSKEQKVEGVGVFSYIGTVVDKESNALTGIEVAWGSQKAVTHADGTFSLNVPNTFKGQHLKIVLSKNGKSSPIIENPSGTTIVFLPN